MLREPRHPPLPQHQNRDRSMDVTLQTGLIIKAQSGFFDVLTEGNPSPIVCQLRGKLKQGRREGDLAAIGDHVAFTHHQDGSGSIDEILPRKNMIDRLDPRPQGDYRQVLLANIDQAVFVFACAKPEPHARMLDRFLVISEKAGIPAIIVFNKADLVDETVFMQKFGYYREIGYPIYLVSAATGKGVSELRELMQNKLTSLAGPSGVGKSSLMNAMQPGLGVRVDNISDYNEKGKHTTNFRQLLPLEGGGWVADTPGWKSLALWDTYPEEIDAYFPEIAPLVENCRFSDCTHTHEPGCAVLEGVKQQKVTAQRYDSYLRLREGQE